MAFISTIISSAPSAAPDSDVQCSNQNQNRQKNIWCVNEDITLMSSWLYVSEDSTPGVNHKGTTLWSRLHKMYMEKQAENPDELSERNIDVMKSRWKRLNENANKWMAACKEACRRQRSGMSPQDLEKEANAFYAAKCGNKFQDLIVFNEVMCKHPKWNLTSILNTPRFHLESEDAEFQESGRSSKRSRTSEDGGHYVSSNPDSLNTRSSTTSGPEGRKKGKCKTSQSDCTEFVEQLRALIVCKESEKETIVELESKRLELENKKMEMKSKNMDLQDMKLKYKTLNALLARNCLSPQEEEIKLQLLTLLFEK